MRYIIFTISTMCMFNAVFGQNLIPNHSFEKVMKIDSFFNRNYLDFNNKMSSWSSPTQSSPDIIHEPYIEKMSMEGTNLVRANFFIHPLKPKSGRIFAGIKVFGCVPQNTHCREYLQVKTLEKLKGGQCYEYSYWTSPLTNGSRINNIGIAFSVDIVNDIQKEDVLDLGNRVGEENLVNPKPGEWQQIKGVIKATEEWNYMIIGNFFHDFETIEIPYNDGYQWGYYLVDEVSLIPVNCKTGQSETLDNELILTINFQTNSALLDKAQILILQGFLKKIKDLKYSALELVGHADEKGNREFNQKLSLKRANNVAQYLIRNGASMNDMIISGLGETKLLSESVNSKNRRVEIKVVF